MARLFLALLIAFNFSLPASYAQGGGTLPLNILRQPDAVSPGDRELLKSAGYALDDGTIHLAGQSALTAEQLSDVLAQLKARGSAASPKARSASDASRNADRARTVIERTVRSWNKTTGQETTVSVALVDDGSMGRSIAANAAPASGRVISLPANAPAADGAGQFAPVAATASSGLIVTPDLAKRAGAPAANADPSGAGRVSSLVAPSAGAAQAVGATASSLSVTPPPANRSLVVAVPLPPGAGQTSAPDAEAGRLASLFLSDDLVQSIISGDLKGSPISQLAIAFDPDKQQIVAQGLFKVPADSLRSMNMDAAAVPDFRFQLAIQLKTTRKGYLILIFPLEETYFYPANSKDPVKDRVVVPVQLLELVLAATRGYLSVLSGDTTTFKTQAAAVRSEIAALDKKLAVEKDPDEKADLKDQREQLELERQGVPIAQRRAVREAKKFSGALGFASKEEIKLDQALAAHGNAIVLKIRLDQFVPYLKGIQLGGVRIVKDDKDGEGENFLAIDLVAEAAQ